MKYIIFTFFSVFFSACSFDVTDYDYHYSCSFIGKKKIEVIDHFGVPSKVYKLDSRTTILVYSNERSEFRHTEFSSKQINYYCEKSFIFVDDVVQTVRKEGNDCYLGAPKNWMKENKESVPKEYGFRWLLM